MFAVLGRVGKVICATLDENEKRFVVIESDPKEFQDIAEAGYTVIQGDDNMLFNPKPDTIIHWK